MKKPELIFLLDMSGSMSKYMFPVIKQYNRLIERLKKKNKDFNISMIEFNHNITELQLSRNILVSKELNMKNYMPFGKTSMTQAFVDYYQKFKDNKELKVFIIITDGINNTNFEYTKDDLKEIINNLKDNEYIIALSSSTNEDPLLQRHQGVYIKQSEMKRDNLNVFFDYIYTKIRDIEKKFNKEGDD